MRILLILALLTISTSPASAQSKALWNACKRDNPDQMIAACTKLIALDGLSRKNRASAYFNRCVAYWRKKQFDQVVWNCTEAISLNAKKPNYHK